MIIICILLGNDRTQSIGTDNNRNTQNSKGLNGNIIASRRDRSLQPLGQGHYTLQSDHPDTDYII